MKRSVNYMHRLEVNVHYTEPITKVIERYVPPPEKYIRGGGRKRKGQEYYTLGQDKLAKETQRCSLANSKSRLKGIIHANYTNGFCMLTLTFRDNCPFDTKDFFTCRKLFNTFWNKLKRSKKLANIDLRYVGVIEFHDNGRIHFHILCRIPKEYIQFVQSKWPYGYIHYAQKNDSAENAPQIASYLSKGIYDERLARGTKRYLGGYGLKRPVVLKFTSRKIIDYLVSRNGEIMTCLPSPNGFTTTLLATQATISELEQLAEAENLELAIELQEGFQSIQYHEE